MTTTKHPGRIQKLIDKCAADLKANPPDAHDSLLRETPRGQPYRRMKVVVFKHSKFLPEGFAYHTDTHIETNPITGVETMTNDHTFPTRDDIELVSMYAHSGNFFSQSEILALREQHRLETHEIKVHGKRTSTAPPVERVATLMTEFAELVKTHPELAAMLRSQMTVPEKEVVGAR